MRIAPWSSLLFIFNVLMGACRLCTGFSYLAGKWVWLIRDCIG